MCFARYFLISLIAPLDRFHRGIRRASRRGMIYTCSSIFSAIAHTFSVLLRQFLLFGCATTARLVLTMTHWGTRRFWSQAFASRIFLPLLNLLIFFHLDLCIFPAHHERRFVVIREQGGEIDPAGPERLPDLCFIVAVPDLPGLPVLHGEEPVDKTVDFGPDIPEQGPYIRTPCPVAQALDCVTREHRDPVIKPGAVPDLVIRTQHHCCKGTVLTAAIQHSCFHYLLVIE